MCWGIFPFSIFPLLNYFPQLRLQSLQAKSRAPKAPFQPRGMLAMPLSHIPVGVSGLVCSLQRPAAHQPQPTGKTLRSAERHQANSSPFAVKPQVSRPEAGQIKDLSGLEGRERSPQELLVYFSVQQAGMQPSPHLIPALLFLSYSQ